MCECSSRKKYDSTIQRNFLRNKAVSDGAISFYLDHFVKTRVSKVTYGRFCTVTYDPNDSDHKSRSHKVFTSTCGTKRIDGLFNIMIPKVSFVKSLFFKSKYFKKPSVCRILKFRRRRNSERIILGCQNPQLIFELVVFLFGVTVEMS